MKAILLMMNNSRLNESLAVLNENVVEISAVLLQNADKRIVRWGNRQFPLYPFNHINRILKFKDMFLWIISGLPYTHISDVWKTAKFLGVPRDRIINGIVAPHISRAWIANLHAVDNLSVNFFATGISYSEVGLDLNRFAGLNGINLSCSNQDLHQGFHIAKHVFARQHHIKFVLIGLAPYSFRYDNKKAFAVSTRNIQYLLTLDDYRPQSKQDKTLMSILNEKVRQSVANVSGADPNYEKLKSAVNKDLAPNVLANWADELDNVTKKYWEDTVEDNLDVFEKYIQLCLNNGAKPVAVVLPFSSILRRHYPTELLAHFRQTLRQCERIYDFTVVDLFDLPLGYECFYNLSHLNLKGARRVSTLIDSHLIEKNIIPAETLLSTNYDRLDELSRELDKNKFNALMSQVFEAAESKLRRKDKIRVGFVLYDASMWCGDLLYRLFESEERYEPTVFLCLRQDQKTEPTVVRDFHHGIEQFKEKGINVIAVEEEETSVERQDIILFLTPYLDVLPKAFKLKNLSVETLLAYIPYGMHTSSNAGICNLPPVSLAWKVFVDTTDTVNFYQSNCRTGFPRGECSGYPKMDYFFSDNQSVYRWKEAQPGSTKIIWAPHWSINDGIKYSTFQWNYKFFYEYAQAHSETSWVVKPHPNLLFSAVKEKLFSSVEEFEEYLARWNELPNAKVETGAYYYDIFASSDGMILDSGSFTLEYQYTHKPMLFLRRESQQFGKFAFELMKRTYCADGKNVAKIAEFIEKILVAKHDPMVEERLKFFNEHLNYRKNTGMLASEYVFNALDRSLKS